MVQIESVSVSRLDCSYTIYIASCYLFFGWEITSHFVLGMLPIEHAFVFGWKITTTIWEIGVLSGSAAASQPASSGIQCRRDGCWREPESWGVGTSILYFLLRPRPPRPGLVMCHFSHKLRLSSLVHRVSGAVYPYFFVRTDVFVNTNFATRGYSFCQNCFLCRRYTGIVEHARYIWLYSGGGYELANLNTTFFRIVADSQAADRAAAAQIGARGCRAHLAGTSACLAHVENSVDADSLKAFMCKT